MTKSELLQILDKYIGKFWPDVPISEVIEDIYYCNLDEFLENSEPKKALSTKNIKWK